MPAELSAALVVAAVAGAVAGIAENTFCAVRLAPPSPLGMPVCRCCALCAAACNPLRSAACTAGARKEKVSGWSSLPRRTVNEISIPTNREDRAA